MVDSARGAGARASRTPNAPSSVGRRYHERMRSAVVRGENQFRADSAAGRVGADQAAHRRGFD